MVIPAALGRTEQNHARPAPRCPLTGIDESAMLGLVPNIALGADVRYLLLKANGIADTVVSLWKVVIEYAILVAARRQAAIVTLLLSHSRLWA